MDIKFTSKGDVQTRDIEISEVVTETKIERVRLRDLNEQILRLKADKVNYQNAILDINAQLLKLQEKKSKIKTALGLTDKDIG
jgi:hypothetical protein